MKIKRGDVIIHNFIEYLQYLKVAYMKRHHTKATKYSRPKDEYEFFDAQYNKVEIPDKMSMYYVYGQYNKSLPTDQLIDINLLHKEEM